MKKRLISLMLVLCMMFSLVPTNVLAAAAEKRNAEPVLQVQNTGGTTCLVTVENAPANSAVYFASYDINGRMLNVEVWNVNGSSHEFEGDEDAKTAKVYLIDQRTKEPLTSEKTVPLSSGTTNYYEVAFAMGEGQDATGVTLPETNTFPENTQISLLPTPQQEGGLFLGWYYDKEMTRAVNKDDTLDQNCTLYAKMGEYTPISTSETPNYITITVPADEVDSYVFKIRGGSEEDVEYFNHVTNLNSPVDYAVSGENVTAAYAQGQTYSIKLKDSSGAVFVVDGEEKPLNIRILNIITEKGEVQNLALHDGLKCLPSVYAGNMTGTAAEGLFAFSISDDGGSVVTQNENEGTFTYNGGDIAVGDTVAIYEGTRPDLRDDETRNESVIYVQITGKDGNVFSYRTADTEDVLFRPDVLPIPMEDDYDLSVGHVTIDEKYLDYSDPMYAEMNLDGDTTADVGDYIAFYTGGSVKSRSGAVADYVRIDDIQLNGGKYVITYSAATMDEVMESMDIYSTRHEEIEMTQSQIARMEADILEQVTESGFLDEAAEYLTALAFETDGFKELSDDLDMDLSSYAITFNDGSAVDPEDMELMKVTPNIDKSIKPNIKIGDLTHFKDGEEALQGIRVELIMNFTVEIEGEKGNKLVIEMQAVFEEEILMTINVSGGAVWKWALFIPYIDDYNLNANIDLGTYTGIGITATVRTEGKEEDPPKFDWNKPESDWAYEAIIMDIGKQIKDLMEQKDEFMGKFEIPGWELNPDEEGGDDDEDDAVTLTNGGLAEKYADMMENAEDSWFDIVRANIYEMENSVDPFHLLVYGVTAEFVVQANLYVTIGMTFEYEVAKRYSFSVMVFEREATSETVDLAEAHYQFDFYVMGTIGIRAGVEFGIKIGLFSLKLDSIGLTAEVGAYAQMWGYFYYHLGWSESEGHDSSYSGAMAIEIGLYLTISFEAQAFSSEKLTFKPALYEGEWPILTIGEIENVYDFAYEEDDERLQLTPKDVRAFQLPDELFDMNYMDMKSGKLHGSESEDEDNDGEPDEEPGHYGDNAKVAKYFDIEITNVSEGDKFTYYPIGHGLIVETSAPDDIEASCQVIITWKGAPLAFTSRSLQRTVDVTWEAQESVRTITFDTNGGTFDEETSASLKENAIVSMLGYPIAWPEDPVRPGYEFLGWQLYNWQHNMYRDDPAFENRNEKIYVGPGGPTDGRFEKMPGFIYDLQQYELTDDELISVQRGILLQARWKKLEGTIPYNLQLWQEVLGSDGNTSYEDAGMLTIDPAKLEGHNRNGGTADERLLLSETVLQLAHATMAERNNTGDIDYHSEFDRLNSELEKVIAGDGSTVFNLYYDLGKAVVTFARGGYYDENTDVYHDFVRDKITDTLVYSARVGTEITVPNMAQPGYILLGYTTGRGDLIEPNTTMVLKDDLSLTAQWVLDDNTPYAIHHYVEKPEGGYELHYIDTRYGTTDTTVSITDADWRTFEGYDAMKGSEINLTRANIAGNGKTALRLYYKISRYTVTFDLNNIWIDKQKQPITIDDVYNLSAADLTQNVAYGKLASAIEPLCEGYAFLGWYTGEGNWYDESAWGEAYDFNTPITGDITLYARWDTAEHTLGVYHYLMRPDGTYEEVYEPLQSKDGKVFKTGDTITLADLVKEEYLADGTLYYQPDSTTVAGTKAETYTIPEDYVGYLQKIKIYYDRYKPYFGGWDFNGGTLTDNNYTTPGSVYVGADLAAPALKRDGYTLIGWAPKLATDPKYTGQMPHAAQVVYVAQWEANGNTPYTVHIYQENAEGEYALKETKKLTGSTNGTVSLYNFRDLYELYVIDEAKTGADSWTIKADGTLVINLYYARESFTLTFMVDGVKYASITEKWGVVLDESRFPVEPTLTGKLFSGWSEDLRGHTLYNDVTVHAEWQGKVYNLTWDLNGGEAYNNYTKQGLLGDPITAPMLKAREGYVFDGWTVDGKDTEPTVISGDMTFTAKWRASGMKLVFHANYPADLNMTDKLGSLTIVYGEGEPSLVNLWEAELGGYKAMGWGYAPDSPVQYALGALYPAERITDGDTLHLYLQWQKPDASYTMKAYVQNVDGTYPTTATETVVYTGKAGEQAQILDMSAFPELFGNVQLKYNLTIDSSKSTLSGIVAADNSLVLEVYYARTPITVNWYKNDTELLYTETLLYGAKPVFNAKNGQPEKPADAYGSFVFTGEWRDQDYKTVDDQYIVTDKTGVDLYPKFEQKKNVYVVTFDANGGKFYNGDTAKATTVEAGSQTIWVAYPGEDPTRTADDKTYTFLGWFTKNGANGDWGEQLTNFDARIDKTITYYAKWGENVNTYTITWYDREENQKSITLPHGTNLLEAYDLYKSQLFGDMIVGETTDKDDHKIYTFAGWKLYRSNTYNGEVTSTTTVYDDFEIYSNWTEATRMYTVNWYNGDGSILKSDQVAYTGTPSTDSGINPTKATANGIVYTHIGWDVPPARTYDNLDFYVYPNLAVQDGYVIDSTDTIHVYPIFEESYIVEWKNYDGTVLYTDTVKAGQLPQYKSDTPKHPNGSDGTKYVFSHWSPAVQAATGPCTYTAQFTAAEKLTVTWRDEDGTLLATTQVPFNGIPQYPYENPKKATDENYRYSFLRWETADGKGTTNIAEDTVYYARYQKHPHYQLTWMTHSIKQGVTIYGTFADGSTEPKVTKWLNGTSTVETYERPEMNKYAVGSDGYTYKHIGWNLNETPLTRVDSFEEPYKNTTYYPIWEKQYDVWVGDTRATEYNWSDILGDGTIAYNDSRHNLTLTGFTYEGAGTGGTTADGASCNAAILVLAKPGATLTVQMNGKNVVKNTTTGGVGILYDGALTLDGNLTVSGDAAGIQADSVYLRGTPDLIAGGAKAIIGAVTTDDKCDTTGYTTTEPTGTPAFFEYSTLSAKDLSSYKYVKVSGDVEYYDVTWDLGTKNATFADGLSYKKDRDLKKGDAITPPTEEVTFEEGGITYELIGWSTEPWDDEPIADFGTVQGEARYYAVWQVVGSFDPSALCDIWIGGVQVSDQNKNDILGNGTASYNAATNTLTLKNFRYAGAGTTKFNTEEDICAVLEVAANTDLTIKLIGDNVITNTTSAAESAGIYIHSGNVTITGDGTLTVTGADGAWFSSGIRVGMGQKLTVSGNCTVNAIGGTAELYSLGLYGDLDMCGGTVHLIGGESGYEVSYGCFGTIYAMAKASGCSTYKLMAEGTCAGTYLNLSGLASSTDAAKIHAKANGNDLGAFDFAFGYDYLLEGYQSFELTVTD